MYCPRFFIPVNFTIMRSWQLWLGVLISVCFLWVALRGLQLAEVLQVLATARLVWLLPGVAAYMLGLWVRTWRWRHLLRPVQDVRVGVLFPVVAIGYMGNNIYPARIGELLRAYILKRKCGVAASATLATVVVERVFDGVVMLGFVMFNLPALAAVAGDSGFVGSIQAVALWGALAFGVALALFVAAAIFPEPAARGVQAVLAQLLPQRWQARAGGLVERFLGGLAALRSPREALLVLLASLAIWLLETGKYWFVMHAFDFSVSFFALMLMNGIVNLATTIPSAPGYVGTFDAPGIAVLRAFGVAGPVAAAYTLLLHAALWLPVTALGLFYFGRESLNWAQVRELRASQLS